MSAQPTRKPWPMKYVVIAILVFVVVYTFITIRYRKPGHAYQPYHDTKERATVARLRSAGYTRIAATADRPADTAAPTFSLEGPTAPLSDEAGGLSADLQHSLIDQPHLPQTFTRVRAPAEVSHAVPYHLEFTCALPDHKQLLSGAYVYVRDDDLAIVPDFEHIEGGLLARTTDATVDLTIPADAIPPGTYTVTLIGAQQSKRWTLQVH